MSNFQHSDLSGRVVSFEKPPHYWLRRAQQHRKRGEHRHAATLLRRAVALDPSSGQLRLEYAHTLRDMSCFEASTREAFGVLALEPSGFLPYGLIGRNMLSLGREQEAMDAFSHFLQKARYLKEPPPFLEEEEDYFALEDLLDKPSRRGAARYEALIHIASLRLSYGDLDQAQRKLTRASRLGMADARLHALYAMLFEAQHAPEKALFHALLSVRKNHAHVPSLCALASVRSALGQRGLAAAALLTAAFHCHYPHDEQLFCFTAAALRLPEPILAMLRLNKRYRPDRVPTLYNLALTLLRDGKIEEALAYLSRCRDLDPEDVTVHFVFQEVQEWSEKGLSLDALRQEAEQLPFYPFLPPMAEQRLLETLSESIQRGITGFVDELSKDGFLYRQFLYALSLSGDGLGRLLFPIAMMMAEHAPVQAERLLRDVLLQNTQDEDVKRLSLSMLVTLHAPPPFVLWQNGRIVQVDPSQSPPSVASVTQRLLARRIAEAQRMARDPRLTGHALRLLYGMGRRLRYAFLADVGHVWRHALVQHFCQQYGLPLPNSVLFSLAANPGIQRRVDPVLKKLNALMRPHKEDPQ